MTRAATEFVGVVTFEALTGRPVHTGLFDAGRPLDHIGLARSAAAIVVAPATADFIARAAIGQADDLLAATLLAASSPVLFVPAMNDHMWAHRQTQQNVGRLRELGHTVIEPETGDLAAREGTGPGRMPEPESIFAHIGRLIEPEGGLAGRRVLVTAGPTREPIDPVRFISNQSSGKMGFAVARAAWRRGATVDLVAAPFASATPPSFPPGVAIHSVTTTDDMAAAVGRLLPEADVLVMAAAPADFKPASPKNAKIKKSSAPAAIELAPTTDILASTRGRRKRGAIVVGFALETNDVLANGRAKLDAKDLDLIAVNDATEPGAGFGVDTNRVTLLSRGGGEEHLPLMSKADVADALLDRVEQLLGGR
jgi:phosphopantothenoylcysteine decarboxylase / phosphopantothenate---cysteine ligase